MAACNLSLRRDSRLVHVVRRREISKETNARAYDDRYHKRPNEILFPGLPKCKLGHVMRVYRLCALNQRTPPNEKTRVRRITDQTAKPPEKGLPKPTALPRRPEAMPSFEVANQDNGHCQGVRTDRRSHWQSPRPRSPIDRIAPVY
jgi:hypothetical protein